MIVISLPHFIGLGLHGGRMDVRKEASPVKGFTGGSFAEVLTFRQVTFHIRRFLPSQVTECS